MLARKTGFFFHFKDVMFSHFKNILISLSAQISLSVKTPSGFHENFI